MKHLEKNEDHLEWFQIDDNCWKECGGKGGLCSACVNYESSAISGYCCSGVNHKDGFGPLLNWDCPSNAVAAQKSNVHSCVVSKIKGELFFISKFLQDFFVLRAF